MGLELEELDLTYNHITDAGAEALAEALVGHPALLVLDLKYNGIGHAGAARLMEISGASVKLLLDSNCFKPSAAPAVATGPLARRRSSMSSVRPSCKGGPRRSRTVPSAARRSRPTIERVSQQSG